MRDGGGIMSVLHQMWGLNLFITFYVSVFVIRLYSMKL